MSDLKSVLGFFIGLVIFILLVAFALGKIKLPKSTALKNILSANKSAKITPSPTSSQISTSVPNQELKQALLPTQVATNKGGTTLNQVKGTTTIPETGTPTFLFPFSLLFGSLGVYLKKKQ